MWNVLPDIFGGMLAGSAGGVLSGLFGVGGGFVMIPLLSLLLGLDQHRAQGTTLAIMMMPVGLPGILQYRKRGIKWNLKIVGLIVSGFMCGVSLGSFIANQIPQLPLRISFTAFLMFMAAYGWFRHEASGAESLEPRSESAVLPGLVIGAIGGITSGLTGLGGAVVIIPLLIYWFRMTQHQAQMTSLLVLLPPIGLPGVLIYAKAQGGLPWLVILGAVVGFDAGSYLGAKIATRMSGARLKRFYSLVLLVMAGTMILKIALR
ncbi:MAG: sulfite exporter TauE/SafE family protein [Holophagales bacterium]|jgi:uncharacterized membrane protein YfcA|nr:sulfite exporter TauE/SafE family protein [Holophagales bacterium]